MEQDRSGTLGVNTQSLAGSANGVTEKDRDAECRSSIPRTAQRAGPSAARVFETSSVVPTSLPRVCARAASRSSAWSTLLSEALPIYSGGLGNVAGDYLKAASDLAVPIVGVGLLYQQGYFRQIIDADGTQRALNPYNDPGQLPVSSGPQRRWRLVTSQHQLAGAQSLAARLASTGRPTQAISARQQRPCEPAGLSRHHQRTLRRWLRTAPDAGTRCSESAVGACFMNSGSSRKSAILMRDMQRSSCWSEPAALWRRTVWRSTSAST